MISQPNPVLLYHPDGYEVTRADLMGRHSAGESFLEAFLRDVEGPGVFGLLLNGQGGDRFSETVDSAGRNLSAVVLSRTDVPIISRQGLLYVPQPDLAREARARSFVKDTAYALCGITHTVSSFEAIDQIADFTTEPVAPFDALICTSKAVHSAVSNVLALREHDLKRRLGATRFTRPLMPIIPLGVHPGRFARDQNARAELRNRLGLSEDTIAILFFGRLSVHAKASPFQLAQAAERAARQLDRPVAVIWGGWFSNKFQSDVFMGTAKDMAPSVSFHHVDGRDGAIKRKMWSAADIFCSLSDNIQESFGLTVIEAMAAGLPVVASNWNGYREAISHGVDGVLIDTYLPAASLAETGYRHMTGSDNYDVYIGGVSQFCFVDIEQTSDWLVRLARDSNLRHRMGEAARLKVKDAFDWNLIIKRYFELWSEQQAMLETARKRGTDRARGLQRHDPAIVFANYPSHHLKTSARLAKGSEFARWDDLLRQPAIVLNPEVLLAASTLEQVRRIMTDIGTIPVADLVQRFRSEEQAAVLRSVHWLIKIGALRLVSTGG
jgi:glycosyltransferase involved in cell wall biosynthesis